MKTSDQMASVRDALFGDPEVRAYAPGLSVRAGDPWRIEGEVGSLAAKRKAARLVRRALVSSSVEDGVTLARSILRSDEELARVLVEALGAEQALASVRVLPTGVPQGRIDQPWIGVMIRDGLVYLGGRVDHLAQKAVAEGIAWETEACSDVRNHIWHESPGVRMDGEIAAGIRTLVGEHPDLEGEDIRIEVRGGEVTLGGRVREPAQRETAKGLCWSVPAVAQVHDRLELLSP
jgi:osmotically-inducible protein OsmY